MTRTSLQPRGLARLTVLCLPVAAALVLPSAAIAASGGSTVRATVGGDGSVKSVKVYAPGGTASDFTGTLPLKLSISRTVSGSTSTYHYRVENTYSKQQTVTYTDTAGKSHTTTAELQLPLVAQLGIQLPSTFKDVSAPAGVVQTDPDGVNRVLFSMVLFSPLGAPTQDVTFTATGSGSPTAELSATAVNPASTAGLSQASQDANASGQQDDFWSSFASGGNGGLTQLADGVGKMVAGLDQLDPGTHQLADGLKAAGDGATKLDAGTKSAFDGSKQLASGSKTASDGAAQLAAGAKSAYGGAQQLDSGAKTAFDGSKALATGSKSAADGATSLSTGLGQLSAGQTQLNGGITQIQAGLAQLDAQTPAAVAGLTAIESGVKQILVGLEGVGGTVASPKPIDLTVSPPKFSVLFGLSHPAGTLGGTDPGGLVEGYASILSNLQTIHTSLAGLAASLSVSDPATSATLTALASGLDQISNASTGGMVTANTGLGSVLTGLQQITTGLDSHAPGTFGATDTGGVDFGLLALLDPTAGLPAAVAGIHALAAGSTTALAGSNTLTAGTSSAFTGSQTLAAGAGQVASGASALSAGVGQISGGLDELTPGLGKISGGLGDLSPGLVKIAVGLGSLSSGLGELSAGQHQVAAGLPAAVSGAAQIAAGTDQLKAGAVAVHDGLLAVQSGAVGPLLTQITQGSQNAKKQLAILDAAGALAAQAPGGAGTAYVLSQSPKGFRLAASTTSSGGSNTGRNIGIGLGGLVALIIAVTAGFALGRRSSVSA